MQVSKQAFCPSSPHSFCGYKCVARSTEALPWRVRVFEMKPEETERVREARQAVADSIEVGVPVQYGNEEDGIVIGFQRRGEQWTCLHPLRDRGQKPFVETQWPGGVVVFTQRKPHMSERRELVIGALRQAVQMARTEEAERYWVGFRAWDDYIARLKAMDTADEKTKSQALLGNGWIYECLAGYRASAARFLCEIAREFESQVAACLTQAADLYEQISSRVLRDEHRDTAAIAPYSGGLEDRKLWTAAQRGDQVRRLEEALPLERDAIAKLEIALSQTAGGKTPSESNETRDQVPKGR